MKGAEKKQLLRLEAEGRRLRAKAEQLDREHGDWPRPRSKVVVVSEAELLSLGGEKEMVLRKDGLPSRIIFGGVGETRLIFTPEGAAWKIALEGKPSLEELKRELSKAGRNLWNAAAKPEQKPDVAATEQKPAVGEDKQEGKPDIAFQAVDALLSCWQNWQDFSALSKSEQEKADVYRAMVNVHLAILTTLHALERDVKTKRRKLQLAFELLTDPQWPSQIGKLQHQAVMLACELERPPSKKELKDRFDPPEPYHPLGKIRPSEFSTLLKAAGLSWLKRGKRDRCLVSLR